MRPQSPRKLIVIGLVLVLLGFILPVLMVIDVLEATLLLSFFAYGASISGLLLGLIGIVQITRLRKNRGADR
ncbi:MAG: hypothetical protein J7M39_00665 [Anaerolineae bacterium]|nr:hypothetical protein [Anaerolineae bacterium]